jgi:hypothetical protein
VQFAWLEHSEGFWRLSSEKAEETIRQWANENAALHELTEEGWIITGPYFEKCDQSFRCYGLNRNPH